MTDLAPDLQPFLDMLAAPDVVPVYESTPQEAREGLRVVAVVLRGAEHDIDGVTTYADAFAGVPARVYRPDGVDGALPTVVFLHGGGFVIGDLDTHDPVCRLIARDCSAVVVALDYPLAPEHPFPEAVDAVHAAVLEVERRLPDLGGDERLTAARDSAGGNLAAVVAQQLRELIRTGQLLLYPKVDAGGGYPSLIDNGTGYFLDTPTMAWFAQQYAGASPAAGSAEDPRLSPLHGDLAGVAPAVVATAELDPLRDEGEAYAAALADAGVRVDQVRYDGLIHGFANFDHFSPSCAAALSDVLSRFRALVHP